MLNESFSLNENNVIIRYYLLTISMRYHFATLTIDMKYQFTCTEDFMI